MPPASLRLADFLDEEVLAIVQDLANYEGYVSSQEFAEAVGLETRNVGTRFSWLRKYGVLERNERVGDPFYRHWRLTRIGQGVIEARFGKAQQNALANLDESQLPLAMQVIAARYEGSGNEVVMHLLRRRLQASIIRRR